MKHPDTKKRFLLFLMFCFSASISFAQIKGTIKTDDGDPLEFATISDATNTFSATTDSNGVFSIDAPVNTLLTISFVGYEAIKIPASDNMHVVLHRAGNVLNEVVAIGYGTQTKKELFGAISTVGTKDFQQGTITTPEQLIAGKVSGVSITSNGGSPGAGSTIRIRGFVSLNASQDPLIIIDGIQFPQGMNIYGASNALSTINPNDIETFTVLKDAAATAIYGSRASNGVILITTKQGTGGKAVFNFSTQTSVSTVAKKVSVLSADEFRKYVSVHAGDSIGGVSPVSLLGSANTNWQDQIYQNAITTDDNFSVSGGIKHMPYRVSVGFLDQNGLLRTDNLKRYSASLNLTPSLLDDHLKLTVNAKGSISDTRFANNAAISSAAYFDPTQPVKDPNSPYGGYYEWASVDGTGATTLNKLAPRNPVALLNMYHNTSTVYRSFGNVQADYKFHFLPELHANLNLGYDASSGNGNIDVPASAAQNFLDGGQKNTYKGTINNEQAEFYLNYNKTLASIKSNINATAGYGLYYYSATNYSYPSFRANGDSIPGTTPKFPIDKPVNALESYYARLIYTFDTKYILAASIRTDGSSRFTDRWGTFPSIAFTWRANKENFLKDSKTISDLKLRLSYGVTGNQDGIGNYNSLHVYNLGDNSSLTRFGNNYYNMATPAAFDPSITWETTATTNIGLDWGFFDNRLSFTADAYYKKTRNLLSATPLPAGSNFTSVFVTNVGNLTNKGIEFQVNATPVRTTNFSWTLNFNVAYNDIKITNLTKTQDSTYQGNLNGLYQINSVGYNPNAFYVYHQVYDKAGKPIEGVYADLNHDGIINSSDLYRYKSPYAKVIMGFSTFINYKQWGLSTVLRANIGNYMYNGIATGASQANMFNPLGYLANTTTEILKSDFVNGQQYSDYYVQNASFLKMDNLSLSYNVGKILHQKAGLRLNATVQNVFTITKYSGVDPEIYGGIDNIIYPRPRIYSLGANIQF